MSSKEDEYKEMFLAEAFDSYEELNQLFTDLEKDVTNSRSIDAIFRITHTLKGNAMGMGFEAIAELSHVMEDIFSVVKDGNLTLDRKLFESLFKANDKLGELIEAIKTGADIKYKGIRTKLKVILNNVKKEEAPSAEIKAPIVTKKAPVVEKKKTSSTKSVGAKTTPTKAKEKAIPVPVEKEESEAPKIAFSDLVQIPIRKLDALLNLVGELIIERDGLISTAASYGRSANDFARLQRITSDLQYGVMDVRLVQVGFLFKKFTRIIRDVAVIESKKVDLALEGTNIEIDRNILKIMSDSLVHLVRNAVSHGIESPEERKKIGKPEVGVVTLSAINEKDTVIIKVSDDGNGVDPNVIKQKAVEKGIISKEYASGLTDQEAIMLIFEAGFSKNEEITEVSGRGVGMDVVRRATESIGGKINVTSVVGKGSEVSLHLPSSMAVKGALLFLSGGQEYAVPLTYTDAVVSLQGKEIYKVGTSLMSNYLDKTISIVFLKDLMKLDRLADISHQDVMHDSFNEIDDETKLDVMIVSHGNKYVGLVVDKLLQQKEIVEKTLSQPLENIDMISGATIMGNGNVCLVLDIARVINVLFKEKMNQHY